MAVVLNNTVRIITIKATLPIDKTTKDKTAEEVKRYARVDLMPGFNDVNDDDWAMVAKTDYAKALQDMNHIVASKATGSGDRLKDKSARETPVGINEVI